MNYFQFNGTTLLKWTDRFGTSHPLDSLGNGQCNLKAPTTFTDEGKITEKSLLPIKSWSYGPRQFENEKMAITIGSLQCEQDNSIEQESQENLSTLKTIIDTKAADIKNEMVNLHDQMEIGTNGKIDDIKLFVGAKVNASETFIKTRIDDLENNLKGLIQDNGEINTKAADIKNEMVNLHDQMEIGTNGKIDDIKLFVGAKVNASETFIKTRIDDLETNLKGLIQDNGEILVDMRQYINECANNPCHNLATCVNLKDGFECNCVTGKVIIFKSRNESSLKTGICLEYSLSFTQKKTVTRVNSQYKNF